jgi:predicted metalloenzyme YecM
MKIEELNTQITTLYTENLRLRASEIALAAQLKRERDKSRKILSDAEAAVRTILVFILGEILAVPSCPAGR